MVHMQVEEPEAALGLQVEEMAPRADARQRGVPALVRTVGDLRKPEMAIVQQAKTLLFIKYGRILALRLSVVAPDADIVVVGKLRQHVVQLAVEHLLTSENVEAVEFDQAAHPRTAALPTVTALGVAPIGVADIIGGYGQLLRRGAKGHGGKQDENQQFLHFKGSFNGFQVEQRYKKRTKYPPNRLPQVNFSAGLVHFRT